MDLKNALHHVHRLVEMEEFVGKIWHGIITRSANPHYPEAVVYLDDVKRSVGVMFRALGGDGGLKIETSSVTEINTRRSWLQRLAGSNRHVELAWRTQEALHLPLSIDVFPETELNRELYLWLAALASGEASGMAYAQTSGAAAGRVSEQTPGDDDWLTHNLRLTSRVLHMYPGLKSRYARLLQAQLALRPDMKILHTDEAQQERAIQAALKKPEEMINLPPLTSARSRPPAPVYLWLHPDPPRSACADAITDHDVVPDAGGDISEPQQQRRYQAEQVDMPDGKNGLILDRFENILSWAEYIKVDRATDEEDDMAAAEDAANDLDKLSVARDSKASAKRIRFDLDLPAPHSDDTPLGEGIAFPEWDYRKACLQKNYCAVQPMVASDAVACELPGRLRATARRIRAQFESLQPTRIWFRGQHDGSEVDLDAYMNHRAELLQGHAVAEQGMFREFRNGMRDLSCLLLADLSLSTDAWVNNHARVIDVIRDSMMLFSEALSATQDQFAMYGFSSRRREHVRVHTLKTFQDSYDAKVRGRIQAVKPGFYTRMGAAIRYTSRKLAAQSSSQRLLIILTDGKPNDLDQYEGRYGVEDTRMSLIEARKQGIQPFCVTIDEKAGDYLPYIFGSDAYAVIRKPSELPQQLPQFYARLTG